jgi:hypothetical protein
MSYGEFLVFNPWISHQQYIVARKASSVLAAAVILLPFPGIDCLASIMAVATILFSTSSMVCSAVAFFQCSVENKRASLTIRSSEGVMIEYVSLSMEINLIRNLTFVSVQFVHVFAFGISYLRYPWFNHWASCIKR